LGNNDIGAAKEKRAIPYLEKIVVETDDPFLVKAAKEAIVEINAGA